MSGFSWFVLIFSLYFLAHLVSALERNRDISLVFIIIGFVLCTAICFVFSLAIKNNKRKE